MAGGVRRLPCRGRGVHERGDDQQPHRDRGGARAGAPGIPPRRSLGPASGRLLLRRGALLGDAGGRAARDRLGQPAGDPAGRLAADAARRAGGRDRSRRRGRGDAGRGRGHGGNDADRRRRSARGDRRRLRGTRRVDARRRRVRAAGGGRPARALHRARARRLMLRRRAQVALPAEGVRRRDESPHGRVRRRRSPTSRGTCRISSTSCTPRTSRWSTRGRSGR